MAAEADATGVPALRACMRQAISALRDVPVCEGVRLFHHNDTDGLTSAAILTTAFRAAGIEVCERVALEKPYLPVLEAIFARSGQIVVFADFCGRIASHIAKLNGSRNLVLILDHHVASVPADPRVFNLDCDLFGLRGDRDATAAAVCWLFADELLGTGQHSTLLQRLASLALLGAVGDGFFEPSGQLFGVNLKAFESAASAGLARWNSDSRLYETAAGRPLQETARALDALGAMAFGDGGPAVCVDFLVATVEQCRQLDWNAAEPAVRERLAQLVELKAKKFAETTVQFDAETAPEHGSADEHRIMRVAGENGLYVLDVGSAFDPMGVKLVGVFLTELVLERAALLEDAFVVGCQDVPARVPGFPDVEWRQPVSKVSARVGARLGERIRTGRCLPLDFLLPNAARAVGGFADACHPTAAAVVVEKARLPDFVVALRRILAGGAGVGVGFGYGKTILAGGDCGFLMWGVNGIVGALPFETVCLVEPLEDDPSESVAEGGWVIRDKRPDVPGYKAKKSEMSQRAVGLVIEELGLSGRVRESPIAITFRGSLLAASGDGASAAFCVSLARALNHAFGLGKDLVAINRAGWMGEHAFHGKPSGVDNTVSTYGGLVDISFDPVTQTSRFEHVVVEPVQIVLAHSGVTADTSSLLGICRAMREADSEKFDSQIVRIKADVAEMRALFEAGDLIGLGRVMVRNHDAIDEMGLSHKRVRELCDRALAVGALGAKVTGGGLGGYCLLLTPGAELQQRVRAEMEAAGAHAILAVTWPCLRPET